MAEVRKITIEIIQKGEEGTPKPPDDTKPQEKASSEGKTLLKSVILNQGYQTAKKLVIQGVKANINNYIALSEDYFAENTYQNVMTAVSKFTSLASTVGSSTLAGAQMGGAVGAVAGLVIGAVGWGVSEYMAYQERMSGYYRALNSSIINKDYARRKSGYYDGGRGTEN